LSVLIYNIFLFFFNAGIRIAALFNVKAKKWLEGRKGIFERLEKEIPSNEKIIWIHCSSLGEFEQARPVMEKLRALYPSYKLLLTFFSPSGYEVQKNYPGADWVFYLPIDSAKNAKRFLEIISPCLVLFIKYEFWYYYLKKIKYRGIPLLLVSALFRKDMSFFKWYGGLQRKMLSRFDHLFVQTEESYRLIDGIGLKDICSISGDTRFDRVIEIAENFMPIPSIEQFIGNSKALVAGSTWKEDEEVLQQAYNKVVDPTCKLIIAPHEITPKHLEEIKQLFPASILFSELHGPSHSNVLIIDNYGLLSRLYKYGYITYVGGGLNPNGVHNVLEAAVYGKVVLFGRYYEKYSEAVDLVISGGGVPFYDDKREGLMLSELINAIMKDKTEYEYRSKAAQQFVLSRKGATQKIFGYIQEKRLLTS
jgi:3-deoxy-D-manno-octulosonic-acid transferase